MTEGYDRANGAANAAGMTVEGSYVLQAVAGATGAKSATAAANADVGVTHLLALRRPNVAPTVSVTSPTNGASFTAPASITLTATAADSDGTITKVEFFQGGTNLIATVTTSPYTFNWTGVTAGSYAITAKATDNLTAVTTSSAVNVTVNAAQALYFIHPDQLNTPRVITDATPQGVWRWDNDDAFGGNIPNSNPSSLGNFTFNPRFPGQYFDSETNNHYNYYRDYSPDIGRYIESDPVGLRGGINTYGYVDSSPLSDSDPEGERNSNQMSPVPILPNSALNRMPGQPGYVPPGAEAEFMACFETCLISRQGACLVGNATGALLGMSVAAVGSAWSFGADYPLIAPLTTAIGSQFGAAVCRTYYFSNSCYQKCSAQQKQNMCPAS